MSAIYILIPITLVILALAVVAFFWAVNSNQYSDLDKAASQILFEKRAEKPSDQQFQAQSQHQNQDKPEHKLTRKESLSSRHDD